jgi:hypothetical protein
MLKCKKPDYENTKTGAPFIESTDAWVGMLLKRQLKEAIESGANFMTLPNPKMVKNIPTVSMRATGRSTVTSRQENCLI